MRREGVDDDLLNPVDTDSRRPAGPGLIDHLILTLVDETKRVH